MIYNLLLFITMGIFLFIGAAFVYIFAFRGRKATVVNQIGNFLRTMSTRDEIGIFNEDEHDLAVDWLLAAD